MTIRVRDLRMEVGSSEDELPALVCARLGIRPDELSRWRIVRKSLDARNRNRIEFVYTIAVATTDEPGCLARNESDAQIAAWQPSAFEDANPGTVPISERPVVVGSGPAGLLAAYYLAEKSYRPLVIERGYPVKERVPAIRRFDAGGEFEPENNYLFGEGGAGCFSDGKLTCRMTGPDVDWVLDRFVECGGRASLVYEHRPHLGSNRLPMITRNLRRRITELGGEYRFGCRLENLEVRDGAVTALETSTGRIATNHVLLGIGHSARDTYQMLHELGVPMAAKAFQLGLRIEHPQTVADHHKYGREEYLDVLGPADYTLTAKSRAGELFSFCMCAGGYVIPSVSESGIYCSNGMSNSRHDSQFANSGLVVTLDPANFGEFRSEHPLAGVLLQRHFEQIAFDLGGRDYEAPAQRARDFLDGKRTDSDMPSSYLRGVRSADLAQVLPLPVLQTLTAGLPLMDKKWRGEFIDSGVLVGPEMRGSSPVRIARDPRSRECPGFAGLYPIGEGAGYAGGIVSAAVDGMRSARTIVSRFAQP